jgi:hypothetical protein
MKDTVRNLTKYDILVFFGKGMMLNMMNCVVAPTNPAIRAAANIVCFLKYGCIPFIKGRDV